MDMCEKGGLGRTCNIQIFFWTLALKARLLPLMALKSMKFITLTAIFKIVTQTGGGPVDYKQVAKISFTL